MKQRYILYSLLMAAPLFMAGCSDNIDTLTNNRTNEDAIKISAGINMGQAGVVSRAWENYSDSYHAMIPGTKISLRTEGEWKKSATSDTTIIIKSSTAIAGDSVVVSGTNEKHYNKLTIDSTATPLYWDDFGTADPYNKDCGRKNGLTMYAVAVNGVSDSGAPVIKENSSNNIVPIEWDVTKDQSGTDGWSKTDLLISNNIQNPQNGVAGSADGRYTFAKRTEPANLIFKHAMSKITVNLKRGAGITDAEVTNGLNQTVTILNMATSGTVNITNGEVTLGTVANNNVTPKKDFDYNKSSVAQGSVFATYSALVYPGNKFEDDKTVMEISILGNNTFPVKGNLMIDKAEGTTATSHTLKAGNHYVFNITVNKTGVNITAQIAPWTTYSAEDTPLLDVTTDRTDGNTTASILNTGFKLYYSDTLKTSYNKAAMFGPASPVFVKYNAGKYSFSDGANTISLYWPNHSTGYFFRGVVALNDTDDAIAQEVSGGNKKDFYPTVTTDGKDGDYVKLTSGIADTNNILIGTHANDTIGNTANGALATSGKVKLTFYHKMAHVTVKLRTTTGTDAVTLATKATTGTDAKEQTMAKVEVLSFKKEGKVLLGAGTVAATSDAASYVVPAITTDWADYSAASTSNFYSRASYMVPQDLTDDMKFKVTVTNADGSTGTYTSVAIKKIEVTKGSATSKTTVSKWEPGCKYEYTLTLKKTGINVTAVLVPWITYTGSTEVPFM